MTTHGMHIGRGDLEIVEHQQGNAVDIELRNPTKPISSLELKSTGSNSKSTCRAAVNVHAGDGAVLAKGLEGDLDFTTGDGSLEIEDVNGSLHADTSDGRVGSGSATGIATARGVEHQQLRRQLDAQASRRSGGDIALQTSAGSITISIPIAVQGSFGHHDIHGKMNGGGNLLTVHTSDGSVTLDKF